MCIMAKPRHRYIRVMVSLQFRFITNILHASHAIASHSAHGFLQGSGHVHWKNACTHSQTLSVHGWLSLLLLSARLRFSAPMTLCTRTSFCERVAIRCSGARGGLGRILNSGCKQAIVVSVAQGGSVWELLKSPAHGAPLG